MDSKLLNKFKQRLQNHRDNLKEWLSTNSPETERILCCDCGEQLNRQIIEEELVTNKIEEVIDRIDCGEFGKCTLCDGEVEEERLTLDYTTSVCLDHYSDNQLRDLERNLELAAKVQQQLLPYKTPPLPGIQLAVRSEPSEIVGGDYFDFFSFRKNMQAFAIADVMGKGIPASMLMSNLQASLRILGPENNKLEKTVTRLNELFRYNLKTIKFITLFAAAIDTKNNTLLYCNAGHNPALWFKPESKIFEFLEPTGPALGILSEPDYSSEQINFQSGDILLFYTDGLTEAMNGSDEFGEERLQNILQENSNKTAQQILAEIFQAVKEFSTNNRDDQTALLIKVE